MRVKGLIFSVIIAALGFMLSYAQQDNSGIKKGKDEIGPAAIWQPGMETLHKIVNDCGKLPYGKFSGCVRTEMKNAGASSQALQFFDMTKDEGFMRDFKEAGKVDVAYSFSPFRANENQQCFLVNGSPAIIDVDDFKYLSKDHFIKDTVYSGLLKEYPNINLFPGDRSGTEYPIIENTDSGGQRFIVNYKLNDGCHACKVLGYANVAFDFDEAGKFIGTKVLQVFKLNYLGSKVSIEGEYGDPSKTIIVNHGEGFTIALDANRTTGFQWQLAGPLDGKIIKRTGNEYLIEGNDRIGQPGKEEWNFEAAGKGKTSIAFKYLRPWEKNTPPAKTVEFNIEVR